MIFSLITNLEHLDVVLASASPRRFEILSQTGMTFAVEPSGIDESAFETTDPIVFASEVARAKGHKVAMKHPHKLVISADTVVVCDNEIMGKPADQKDAYNMLSCLSGKTHLVYTAFGLFLQKYDKQILAHESTEVTFRKLTDEEIWAYIGTGEPDDKAGAYAIQGQGAMLVKGINGCFYNVVGFPLAKFFTTLDSFLQGLALHE